MEKIIVVNDPKRWKLNVPDVETVSSREYLTHPRFATARNLRVFNLCRDYRYQTKGYYVSLMAEARGHKPMPDMKQILDLRFPSLVRLASADLEELIQKSLRRLKSKEFVLSVYFGCNVAARYQEIARELHRLFPVPFFRARFTRNKKWILQGIRLVSMNEIPKSHLPDVRTFAKAYFGRKRYVGPRISRLNYDLAILVSRNDPAPPSNRQALNRFADAAERTGIRAEIIESEDYNRVSAFDALFIRENTHANNETYRFARRAQSEGIALIDYPENILKCNNKVYVTELLELNKVSTPRTIIVHSRNRNRVLERINLPCVLKMPDSTFSMGVFKVETDQDFHKNVGRMLELSDLIIAQEYVYTDFDWRIGILDGTPLFACKYFMARGHWQIFNWETNLKKDREGGFECLPVEEAPAGVISMAVRAAGLVNPKGLFGVDLKVIEGRPTVIEVNDNPNIDYGVEDLVLKDSLYDAVIAGLKKRIEEKS